MLTNLLKEADKKCSENEINIVVTLFEKHTTGIPEFTHLTVDGHVSYGFYLLFLKLTKFEANPEAFFQILEIDRKIGWTNPSHVEFVVFDYKGIKIIEDEEVSGRINFNLLKPF